MRNTLLPIIVAVLLFIFGVSILNVQLWYSAREDNLAGARYVVNDINVILDEASHATKTASDIAQRGCDQEGQYRLGTETALQPHLRTIFIYRQGVIWCSSLPGNHVLLSQLSAIPESRLWLASAGNTVNARPVLLYQTQIADSRIVVTISDQHIRDTLRTPLKEVGYTFMAGNSMLGLLGDVTKANPSEQNIGRVNSAHYPFAVRYNQPPLISTHRLLSQGMGIIIFIVMISCLAGYALERYLNRSTTPEEALRRAIMKGEIVPFYQPVVNGKEGTLRGVEVLARWKHPKAGFISPASFIPVAEKSGLIIPLTQRLMAQVVENMNAIASKLPEGFHVGINFSASHITSPTFVDECLRYKARFDRKDLNLVIEVTEREPLHVDEHLVETLNILHENGFVIALDDFGTGYSGLSYLHDLHIDYIKIDQSFVARVSMEEDSTRILDCVLDLARKLSLSIVAEGVETKEQVDYLNRNDITFQQGYYFFKPVSFTELIKIILSKPKVKVIVE
ncbi:EAL domain-containing protein [Citrobacter sp. ku-bf4]|uniref:EAL domain-containing protein n=1 Tax=Citrobacter TaxID=544 RepID=UPI00197EBD9D|nr:MULTISPECIES: cyclic diguanylate phosphodiesterase [Citrobacter]MBN6043180.1 EAL domain-containing protein [Citrobacter sp. ku-bf4]MBS0824556.1 EAL domain-containing protein [Citrobacter amalonaticus]